MTEDCLQLIDGLPTQCVSCHRSLCLRQQVLNLALGSDEELLCLPCLALDNQKEAATLLADVRAYVLSRECFAKEWRKYPDQSNCPDPAGCEPARCCQSA